MLTPEQIKELKSQYGFQSGLVATPTQNTGKASDFLDIAKQTLSNIADSAKEGVSKFGEGFNQIKEGVNNPSTIGGIQQIGKGILHETIGGLETLASPITGSFKTGIQAIPEDTKKAISEGVAPVSKVYSDVTNAIGDYFGSSEALQKFVANNPDAEQVVKDARDLALTLIGGNSGKDAVKSAVEKSVETIAKTKPVINTIKEGSKNLITKTKDIIPEGIPTATKAVSSKIAQGVKNVATNYREGVSAEKVIQALPKVEQSAVRAGVDIADTKELASLGLKGNTKAKELANAVIKYADKTVEKASKTDPREIVGSQIINSIKTAETKASGIGAKLAKASENLGKVTTDELKPVILSKLEGSIPGIKLTRDGFLDFRGTALQSALSKADQMAIQKAFVEATKGGTGLAKHRLRQNLFEILDGAKRSLSNLNATQENALQAIRSGLLDVLESKNPTYKTLSKQFAEISRPVSSLRKIVKATSEEGDIVNLKAGILARRLTSQSVSGVDLKDALRSLDKVTGLGSEASTEKLQDLLNILSKYYDIDPATSYKALTKGAMSESTVMGMVNKLGGELISETPAVRQKAMEELLKSIF